MGDITAVDAKNGSLLWQIPTQNSLIYENAFSLVMSDLVSDNKNIIFLNPSDTKDGFFIETGWTSIGNKIKVPTKDSVWRVKGNNILSDYNGEISGYTYAREKHPNSDILAKRINLLENSKFGFTIAFISNASSLIVNSLGFPRFIGFLKWLSINKIIPLIRSSM